MGIPTELWMLVTGLAGMAATYLFGTILGKKSERNKQAQRDLKSAKDVKDRKHEVEDETDQELHGRLTRR